VVACDIAFIRRILAEGGGLVAGPGEREMFERLAKLLKTDRMGPWRLDQAARSFFLTEFVSAFFLAALLLQAEGDAELSHCRQLK